MKTQLKDVVHLYIGQQLISYFGDAKEIETIQGVVENTVILDFWEDDGAIHSSVKIDHKFPKGKEPKLILRSLSDKNITKEEYKHIWETLNTTAPVISADMKMEPKLFLYLIQQGFDLFGLIESGQAVE